MAIKKITIEGLRGFSQKTEINLAVPDGKIYGSGLTVLVGPNNSGKSTVIEAIHLLSINNDIIPLSARNSINDKKIQIEAVDNIGHTYSLQSTNNRGAFVEKRYDGVIQEHWNQKLDTFILTSKRNFSSTFRNNSYQTRENYAGNVGNSEYRNENNINSNFGGRLLTIYKNRNKFDNCLEKVVNPIPEWTIESSGNNSLYLEFSFNGTQHSSNGAGDGYINIFNIVDSLYDSSENNVIIIDEPEISLHPDLQRKLFKLLIEYSKDKQVIISTHSPYFVDWELFSRNSKIVRFRKEPDGIKKYELQSTTKDDIKKIINDSHHPHILSLDANEIFFLNDNVILTEGQDDVLCYKKIFARYKFIPNASFFGWGAGGADKMKFILNILKDLGYKKVFVILDNDKKEKVNVISDQYPNYQSYAIATHDVRNKDRDKRIKKIIEEVKIMEFDDSYREKIISLLKTNFPDIEGLITNMKNYDVNPKYNDDISSLINSIKEYFSSEVSVQDINNEDDKTTISIIKDDEVNSENRAHQLLDKYIFENELYNYLQNKYKYLEFKKGGGDILSLKKLKSNLYYAIIEDRAFISSDHGVITQFHLIINIRNEKVRLKAKKIISNTLPKKY